MRCALATSALVLASCAGASHASHPTVAPPLTGPCTEPAARVVPLAQRPPALALPTPPPGRCELTVEDEDPCAPNATEIEAEPTLERSRQARAMRHAGELAAAVDLLAAHESEDAWFRPMLRYRALLLRELGRVDEADLMQQRYAGSYGDGRTARDPICLRNRHEVGELLDARRWREVRLVPAPFGRYLLHAREGAGEAVNVFLELRRGRYESLRTTRVNAQRDGNGCLHAARDADEALMRNRDRDGEAPEQAYVVFDPAERDAILSVQACARGELPSHDEPAVLARDGVRYERVALHCPAPDVAERALLFRTEWAPEGPCAPPGARENPVTSSTPR